MNKDQYRNCRIIVSMVLAAAIGAAIVNKNYIIPIIGVIIASAVMYYFRKKTTGILADERDYQIAGKAARTAYSIFTIAAVILSFYFITKEQYAQIGYTLSYSVCALMLLYVALFSYYKRR